MTLIYLISTRSINTKLDSDLSPFKNLLNNQIQSRYFSPYGFCQTKSKWLNNCFSIFHNNVVSLNSNLENLQVHVLQEIDFHFDLIGISETKITNANQEPSAFHIPGNNFEYAPKPLSFGGVGLFVDEQYNYRVIEKTTNSEFQACFSKKKNIICAVMYRQHNNPDRFLKYFEESVERYSATGKQLCILGDYNLDLLKLECSNCSHDFLMCPQSCYMIPTIDKPTRVRKNSAALIDNIFVNNPDQVIASGNIVSDVSDHFSQFYVLKSSHVSSKPSNRKTRDFSHFSRGQFINDLSLVE